MSGKSSLLEGLVEVKSYQSGSYKETCQCLRDGYKCVELHTSEETEARLYRENTWVACVAEAISKGSTD